MNDERANEAPLRGPAAQVHERDEGLAVPLVHPEPGDRRAALLPQRVREESEAAVLDISGRRRDSAQ